MQQCSRVVLVGQGNCFFPVNKVEKGEEEEEEEVDVRTTMQFSVAMQQSCTCWPRKLFLSSKQGVEDGKLEEGGGGGGGGGGGRRGRRGELEEEEEEEEVDIKSTMQSSVAMQKS